MPATSALIEMATERGGAKPSNGQQHFDVLPTDPLAARFDECLSRGADKIGHLGRVLEAWVVTSQGSRLTAIDLSF